MSKINITILVKILLYLNQQFFTSYFNNLNRHAIVEIEITGKVSEKGTYGFSCF